MKKLVQIIVLVALVSSCASTYKSINPSRVYYQTKSSSKSNVELAYKYGVLSEFGNKKYAKNENKNNIKVVSIQITNNSDKTLKYGTDFRIKHNGATINYLQPEFVKQQLKQPVPIYLLYMLLSVVTLNPDPKTGKGGIPIGYALGPGITIGNMAIAGTANKKFKENLEKYSLIGLEGKTIAPGEKISGLIGVNDSGYSPLTIE